MEEYMVTRYSIRYDEYTSWLGIPKPFAIFEHYEWFDDGPVGGGWAKSSRIRSRLRTREEAEDVIEGVLIRSRIKPDGGGYWDGSVYLSATVNCTESGSLYIYTTTVYFGRWAPKPVVFYPDGFGGGGRNDKDGILDALKGSIERAITVYIKANFNL